MEDELQIDETNFDQYFFDVRKHKPQPGQVMAKYVAVAEFVSGVHKKHVIKLLKMDKAVAASKVMRKIHWAKEPDCYRVCREMAEDLLAGMSEEQVDQKPYQYALEAFFYTKKDHVPKNDPHWQLINVMKWDEEKQEFAADI